MFYLEFLARLHHRLSPRTYLEIGTRNGWSLAAARCRSIGIDPAFAIDTEITAPVSLIRRTSDDYFATLNGSPFEGAPVDLAFIDGMHLFEFALRDFINIERHATWSTVAIFDDVCPPNAAAAQRAHSSFLWTGDVFKLAEALRRTRPDLTFVLANTQPTGLLLTLGLDPDDTTLTTSYDEIVAEFVRDDPQDVPDDVLRRSHAVAPHAILRSPLVDFLRDERGMDAADGRARIRDLVAGLPSTPTPSATPERPRRRSLFRRTHSE